VKRIVRKLLTKPIWWWERKRPYPIRSRFHLLPPLCVVGERARFVVLTTPQGLNDAVWTAWSWYRYLRPHGFELQLAVDGEIPAGAQQAVRRLFPGISIYAVQSVYPYVCERQPSLATFLHQHPMGRKLGLMLALSDQGAVLYSDGDVLAFNPPVDLLACVDKNVPCYFMEDLDGTRDPRIVERSKTLGLEFIPRFNAGCLFIPKGALSIDLAAQLLAEWQPPVDSWFTEQTVMSILMRKANALALPDDRYVISARRQFYLETDVDYKDIVARHFTGTVRHVMYRHGITEILRQSKLFSWEDGRNVVQARDQLG
jgi:hypothetical protein